FDAEGQEIRRFEPAPVRQVISPETARLLTRILVRAVESGTGHNAAIAGYEVAGKTGTAQKLDPATRHYSRAPGVLSFVGWAPADEPRFVMLVTLDEPRNEQWGSEAAAPVFSAIGRDILRYLEVPPRDAPPVQIVTGPVPDSLAPGVTAPVKLVSTDVTPDANGSPVMPDVTGRTLRSALVVLAPLHLAVEIQGQGRVVRQAPRPGEPLRPGLTARLALAPGAALSTVAVGQVLVPSARESLARLADTYYGHPLRALLLVGITGTNGKTTTSYLVEALLRARGLATGVIGTIQYVLGAERRPARQTTPDALELQSMLALMRDRAIRGVAMEVSSHALALSRVDALAFDVAVFTNL